MPPEIIVPFNEVYKTMRDRGVVILDLIEVDGGVFTSFLKPLRRTDGDIYDPFKAK